MVAEFTLLPSFLQLMLNNPTPEQVLAFEANERERAMIEALTKKSREGSLKPEDREFMEHYHQVEPRLK